MNHTHNMFKDQGLTFNKTFFSSINSRDSHSPVPRLNLSKLKYKDKKTDMKVYANQLEESIKYLREKINTQAQEFDKLRHKYVKMGSQNKKLFQLNERLKQGLKAVKGKMVDSNAYSRRSRRDANKDESKCSA